MERSEPISWARKWTVRASIMGERIRRGELSIYSKEDKREDRSLKHVHQKSDGGSESNEPRGGRGESQRKAEDGKRGTRHAGGCGEEQGEFQQRFAKKAERRRT